MDSYPHSYAPLFETLDKFGYSLKDLQRKANLADKTMLKIINGDPVMISSICKIAILLGVELSDIVAPNFSWTPPPGKPRKKEQIP